MSTEALIEQIVAESERIVSDCEARGATGIVNILAIAQLGSEAHRAVTNMQRAGQVTDQIVNFANFFIDHCMVLALRDRGWKVEHPDPRVMAALAENDADAAKATRG